MPPRTTSTDHSELHPSAKIRTSSPNFVGSAHVKDAKHPAASKPQPAVADDFGFLSLAAGREEIRLSGSYDRLPHIIALSSRMERAEWLTLLGEVWSICDNISEWRGELFDTHFSDLADSPLALRLHMMTADERTALKALPEIVTIFRGCYVNNKRGLSWTPEKTIATKIPTFMRYRQDGQPLLLRARVSRDEILALKLHRGEAEVIAKWPKIEAISHIKC